MLYENVKGEGDSITTAIEAYKQSLLDAGVVENSRQWRMANKIKNIIEIEGVWTVTPIGGNFYNTTS